MEGKKANLFIVGAMKAGTTSFAELLSQHPEIFFSPIKEPHYFVDALPKQFLETSRFFSLEDYFKNQYPAPRHSVQVSKEEHYQHLFLNATNEKYLAEASTSYLHAPEAAERIYSYNPNAKIIILTRDPLARAFSHYNMDLGLGRIKKSFASCLEQELQRYKNDRLPWHSYIKMSCYKKPIAIYQNAFKNVLVLSLENLITNTELEMGKVAAFLNIESFGNVVLEKTNAGRILKFQSVLYYLKKIGIKDFFSKAIPLKLKIKLFRMFSKPNNKTPVLEERLLQQIRELIG